MSDWFAAMSSATLRRFIASSLSTTYIRHAHAELGRRGEA